MYDRKLFPKKNGFENNDDALNSTETKNDLIVWISIKFILS